MTALRHRGAGERGTSLVEVMVAMTLAVVVMATVMGSFITFGRAEQRQSAAIDQHQDLRRGIDEIARTVRAAWPLRPAPDSSAAVTEITFEMADDDTGVSTRRLRYDVESRSVLLELLEQLDDPGNRQLLRQAGAQDDAAGLRIGTGQRINPGDATVIDRRVIVDGVDEPATPFVRYFTTGDRELVPGERDPKTIAACTVRVRITLGRAATGDGQPLDMSTDVTLRNVAPEEVAC